MFYNYGTQGFLIIIISLIFCFLFYYFSKKIIKSRKEKRINLAKNTKGIYWIIVGLCISLSSLSFHIYYQIDLAQSKGFFRALSEITFETAPLVGATISSLGTGTFSHFDLSP